jgi:glycosyltransferase involved in cell wall biosynthesis
MTAERIDVLLATYNGERFLPQQVDSILAQADVNLSLTVRDDGSTDGTRELLRQYAARDARVRVVYERNIGWPASFFALLALADPAAEYFAFADQDDEWVPDKLARAVALLRARSDARPLLYCSALQYVDRDLRPLGVSSVPRNVGFPSALVENAAAGSTIVMNGRLRRLLVEHPPSRLRAHDWWCYLVAAALGEVVYDPAVTVRYRQHGSNFLGASPHYLVRLVHRLRKLARGRWTFRPSEMAAELLACFGPRLAPEQTRILRRLVASQTTLRGRLGYAVAPDVRRPGILDGTLLRLLILAGRI